MLAGRKLLLADDSITIQKVVALTFADEGIEVLAVSNGAEAIERLEDFRPDVVLADVYMPRMTGLEVCDYIKRNEKLKHIPVMLLVGSFEPFDEAEARRVGAEDTLTKPFQSIRTLVEKVGGLLGREPTHETPEKVSPAAEPAPVEQAQVAAAHVGANTVDGAETLELPGRHAVDVPEEPMDAAELELTTADTLQLSPEIHGHVQQPSNKGRVSEPVLEEPKMGTQTNINSGIENSEAFGETLLDLGDFEAAPLNSADDVILDIDFDSPATEGFYAKPADNWQSAVAVEAPAPPAAVTDDDIAWTTRAEEVVEWEGEIQTSETGWAATTPVQKAALVPDMKGEEVSEEETAAAPGHQESSFSTGFEVVHSPMPAAEAKAAAPITGKITLEQLSPEAIDAIAHRVVEQLSEKVVQQIAWEVVPQLAELMIKRKLEESR